MSAAVLGKQRPGTRFYVTKRQATSYIGYFVPFPKKKKKKGKKYIYTCIETSHSSYTANNRLTFPNESVFT